MRPSPSSRRPTRTTSPPSFCCSAPTLIRRRGSESKGFSAPKPAGRQRTLAEFEDRTRTLAEEAATAEPAQAQRPHDERHHERDRLGPDRGRGQKLEEGLGPRQQNTEADRSLQFAHGQFLRQLGKHPKRSRSLRRSPICRRARLDRGWQRFEDRNRARSSWPTPPSNAGREWKAGASPTSARSGSSGSITYRDRLAAEVPKTAP